MAVIQVYHHGVTCGIPGNNHGMAGKRGTVQGWTHAATNNNVRFLRSVSLPDLTGTGIAFTLTVKTCPPSGLEWHKLRRAFIKRMERLGMSRLHWVTEWQRRGVPHLHGVVYFPEPPPDLHHRLREAWCQIAAPYGATSLGQHTATITDSLGWLKYLAKHAARGVSHYQRAPDSIPSGWNQQTGRVWGHTGDWVVDSPCRLQLDSKGFFRFRRVIRGWRVADARSSGSPGRLVQAKRMLQDKDKTISQLRGVSEWVPAEVSLRVVEFLAATGSAITS